MLGLVSAPGVSFSGGGILYTDLFGSLASEARVSAIGATFIVLIQALLVNSLVDTFRMTDDRTWIPGALYALVASCLPDFLFLTPSLIATTFIPIALRRIFSVYKMALAFGPSFDTAFWITVAALFHPAAVWLLPPAFMGIITLRSFQVRERMVFLTGIFVPVFLAFSGYFWFNRAGVFFDTQFSQWARLPSIWLSGSTLSYLKAGLLVILLIAVFLGVNVYYYKRLIQVQKYITILFWFLFAGIIAAVFQQEILPEYSLLIMPSIAIFLAYSFLSFRNSLMAEIFHFGLLAAVFYIQFFR